MSDAVALFRPSRPEALQPFLDLEDGAYLFAALQREVDGERAGDVLDADVVEADAAEADAVDADAARRSTADPTKTRE